MIACVLVPYFAAAVERREDPSLAGMPLVIGELAVDSGKVYAVSSDAGGMGVAPGMSLRQARALCPRARFLPAAPARYRHAFEALLEVLSSFTSRLEPDDHQPAATGYLDLGRIEQTEAADLARRLGQSVREAARLAPAIGLARGKFPARLAAASTRPNKAAIVPTGGEAAFLAPFPVELLPLDADTARWLRLLGIRTLGQLAALPASAVLAQFGVKGRRLHQLARGDDDRPGHPHRPRAVESVSRQLDGPVADLPRLETITQTIAGELAQRLQARGLVGRELRLILHLEDGTAHQERLVMRQPTSDTERLARILGEFMGQAEIRRAVTELQVILADLAPAIGHQLDLFTPQTGQAHRLRQVLGDLVARYGADCFHRVCLLDPAAPLPERRFHLREVDAS